MPIIFDNGWDTGINHTSGRSRDEVERIIRELPTLSLSYDFSNGVLKTYILMNFDINVVKGIHDDSHGKHITIRTSDRTWHLYLTKVERRVSDNTFLWQVYEVR